MKGKFLTHLDLVSDILIVAASCYVQTEGEIAVSVMGPDR